MKNYHSGHFAETLALAYLRLKGYSKLADNYVTGKGTGAGEVDLIVRKGNIIVFVEVKKRTTIENAAYAITIKQQTRIRRAAEAFLAAYPQYANCDIRFDAVLVQFPYKIEHIKNAF